MPIPIIANSAVNTKSFTTGRTCSVSPMIRITIAVAATHANGRDLLPFVAGARR